MKLRFQADANLDGRVIDGLKRAAPELRIGVGHSLARLPDPDVLSHCALHGLVLVTQDRRTMPGHFASFIRHTRSPGIILLRKDTRISTAIEEIVMIWATTEAEEWVNRIAWIPL